MKRCMCWEHKGPNPLPETEFHMDRTRPDGLAVHCKECSSESGRRWRKAHPDKVREASRRYYAAHPEKAREKVRRRMAQDYAVTRDSARHHYEMWTGPQLEIAAREDLTARQVAVMTGRTLYAVYSARHRLREDPRIISLAGLDDPADAVTRPGMSFGPVTEDFRPDPWAVAYPAAASRPAAGFRDDGQAPARAAGVRRGSGRGPDHSPVPVLVTPLTTGGR
jgi:hypothetical protein